MSRKSLYIAYDGPALASHEMDVRELAPALLALSTVFEEANALLNKERAKISVKFKGSFKTGSFGFDLSVAHDLLQSILNLGSRPEVQSAAAIATLLGFSAAARIGVIQVLRWIKGRRIDRIEIRDTHATIYIDDEFLEIEEKVLQLLRNERIRRALEDAITKPLEHKGIDTFAFAGVRKEQGAITIITREEAGYYIAPKPAPEDLGISEYETVLQIIGITFQDKNKWRFSDGISNTFYADMLDEDFLAKIDRHEILFGKGDIIRARVRESKSLDPTGNMRAERAIVHVYEHRNACVQLKLVD